MNNLSRPAALSVLNGIVLLWGATGVLGQLISVRAIPLVFYRTLIVAIVLALWLPVRGISMRVPLDKALRYAGVGALIGIHWMMFYGAVKAANIATGVLTLSTGAFFTALVEPFVFRRKMRPGELVIGAVVVLGVALLLQVEVHAGALGLMLGLGSSLVASVFGVFNGKLAPHEDQPARLVFFEMTAAAIVVSLCFIVVPDQFVAPWHLSGSDLGWLIVLAVMCTIVTQVLIVSVLRVVSPFTVAVATNLEPVYALLMAAVLFHDEQPLRARFYIGTALLLGLVFVTSTRRARGAGAPRG